LYRDGNYIKYHGNYDFEDFMNFMFKVLWSPYLTLQKDKDI